MCAWSSPPILLLGTGILFLLPVWPAFPILLPRYAGILYQYKELLVCILLNVLAQFLYRTSLVSYYLHSLNNNGWLQANIWTILNHSFSHFTLLWVVAVEDVSPFDIFTSISCSLTPMQHSYSLIFFRELGAPKEIRALLHKFKSTTLQKLFEGRQLSPGSIRFLPYPHLNTYLFNGSMCVRPSVAFTSST